MFAVSSPFICLFVCLLAGLRKTARPIFTKFGGKVAQWLRKKPLDFGGNPDLVTLDRVRVPLWLRLGGMESTSIYTA